MGSAYFQVRSNPKEGKYRNERNENKHIQEFTISYLKNKEKASFPLILSLKNSHRYTFENASTEKSVILKVSPVLKIHVLSYFLE